MPLETLENGKSFLEQRTKINAAIDEINSITDGTISGGIPVTATGTTTPRSLADWTSKETLTYNTIADAKTDTKLGIGQSIKVNEESNRFFSDGSFIIKSLSEIRSGLNLPSWSVDEVLDFTLDNSLIAKRKTPLKTILTTGQSNMVGSSNILQGSTTANQRVRAWNARYTGNGTNFILAEPGEIPFNGGGQQHIGFNAGKYLAESYGFEVDIINMANGGQSIDRWVSTDANPEMWEAIDRECSASYALTGNKIGTVMWHQGEADSFIDVLTYVEKFESFREQVLSSDWSGNDVKFIIGGLALGSPTTGTSGAAPSMNLAFSLLSEKYADIYTVYTGDLLSDSTGIHFTDLSIIEIGKRYGEAVVNPQKSGVQPTRYVEAATNMTYSEGQGKFRDIEDMLDFLSTLKFKNGARITVTIPAGSYEVTPMRPTFDSSLVKIQGELAGGFTQPVAGDFTGTEAADLAMLESKYLTKINVTSGNGFIITNGEKGGFWQDMLFTHTSPTLAASFLRASDPSLDSTGGGVCSLKNVALHGALGNSCVAVRADESSYFNLNKCVISHCDKGVIAISATIKLRQSLSAHTPNAVEAVNRAFVDSYGLSITGGSGVSYRSSNGAYVDARLADDNFNVLEDTNGIVQG